MKKFLKLLLRLLLILAVLIVIIYILSLFRRPSLNRDWADEAKILPNFTITDNTIEIRNLRDWRYEFGKVISKNYYDEVFDLDKISGAYLLFNPFGQWDGMGHSFFVFEFEDGKAVSVSIEARKEKDEDYGVILGTLNQYEIWYTFGHPADSLAQRAIYYEEDLYMYPLLISKESARALFVDVSKIAHGLETNPQFYNTVTSNCTNLLADSANRIKKGSVPFHYARLFTGYADDYLYKLNLIPHDKPFDQIFVESRVDEIIRNKFKDNPEYGRDEFWTVLMASF